MSTRAAARRPAAAPRHALSPPLVALLESALVLAAWLAFATWVGEGGPLVAYDAFRDMAYAHGILAGGLGRDPTLPGLPAWYPPGEPLAFACLSRLSGVPVVTLFATSVYWLGWAAPLAIFWLARRGRGPVSGTARAAWALALAALAVGPGAFHLADAGRFVIRLDAPWQAFIHVADAVAAATPEGAAVAAPPETSYFLAGLTGRSAVALPAGHTNPAVDPFARAADVESLLTTHDDARFAELIRRHHVAALLLPAALTPGDPAPGQFAARPALTRIALPESGWVAYRVGHDGGER